MDGTYTRRTVLAGGVALTVGSVAGCTGEETPSPETIPDGEPCAVCGMVVTDHPGPVGETYFDAEEGPRFYCSSSCTYRDRLDESDAGTDPIVTYLTDYSSVDYEVYGEDELLVSAHLDVSALETAEELDLVVDSAVEGAMGPSLIPFSERVDANDFQEEYGGDIVGGTDVTEETMSAIGR